MVTKAIVEEIVDKNCVKVRIPLFDKIKSDPTGTPTDALSKAYISTLPACDMCPQLGDVVYVAFEDNDIGRPVIIGYLQRNTETSTQTNLTVANLRVTNNLILPQPTYLSSAEEVKDSASSNPLIGGRYRKDVSLPDNQKPMCVIGCGTAENDQKNAFVVSSNGDIYIRGHIYCQGTLTQNGSYSDVL